MSHGMNSYGHDTFNKIVISYFYITRVQNIEARYDEAYFLLVILKNFY